MDYYKAQLQRLSTDRSLKIQLCDDKAKTNWLNINLDSIEALEQFLAQVKAARIAEITEGSNNGH